MNVTEVLVKLAGPDATNGVIRAYCSVTIDDCFVIRDVRIIEAREGHLIVAFPSKKISAPCHGCGRRNPLQSRFCNECGRRLHDQRILLTEEGRPKLYADIAHPIRTDLRERMNAAILDAYRNELEASKTPGHVSAYETAMRGLQRPRQYSYLGREEGAPLSRRVERVRI